MRWPWKRLGSSDLLVVSWAAQTLSYVLARSRGGSTYEILKLGVERQGDDSMEDFLRRLQGLGLKGREAYVMLRPEQYQVLQIDAPAVPPEELRAAARYQIREMLESHVDDVTLDVMRVGDGQQKGAGNLFVVTATNAVVRGVLELCTAMHWTVSVIDIQETAQRNLQSALVAREGRADRANAALVLVEGHQAVLTISAKEELFYTRRLEVSEQFLAEAWGQQDDRAATGPGDGFAPVEEYVPDYSVGGVSYGNDYSEPRAARQASQAGLAGDGEGAQRFLVEVQRSLDVWDRTWSSMPLNGVTVYAGHRTQELAQWLGVQLGQTVIPMDLSTLFSGFKTGQVDGHALCLPLLGILMRTEDRKL
jgi:MSHA biogenesis protein MshI